MPTAPMIKPALKTEEFYQNPTRRILRNGCFEDLPEVLNSFRLRSILLVLGEKSFRASTYFPRLEKMLEPCAVFFSRAVPQNPTQAFIQEEINRLKGQPAPDLVLAIGGGSVLDVSKLLAAVPWQEKSNLKDYIDRPFDFPVSPRPLVVMPTTAGTGSEVTPYASLETSEKKKITLGHPLFYPEVALIDPELCYSMPAYVTACTGFDALSQAIESFWSIHATPFSRTHALRATELILESFERAHAEPLDARSRFDMSLAGCEAGLAIAQTKTTAVHSVSYPITTHFQVAHGHACALTLAEFVRFNAPVLKEEGRPLLSALKTLTFDEAAKKIESLMKKVKLERSLSKLGIHEEEIALILRDGFRPDRIKNNPRPVQVEDLRAILNALR